MKKTFPLRWHSEQLFLSWRTPSHDFRYFQNAVKELKGLLCRNSWLLQWFKRIYWIFRTVIEQCDVIVFWVRVKNKTNVLQLKVDWWKLEDASYIYELCLEKLQIKLLLTTKMGLKRFVKTLAFNGGRNRNFKRQFSFGVFFLWQNKNSLNLQESPYSILK